MKKIKIMLLSFALIAIVGGAFAFKAKNLKDYCTAVTESDGTCLIGGVNKACPGNNNGPIHLTTAAGTPRFTYCYATQVVGRTDCKKADGTTDVICITTPTSFKTVE